MKASSATFTVVKASPIEFGATAAVGGRYSALRTNPTDRELSLEQLGQLQSSVASRRLCNVHNPNAS
jgi:hypothetical protein